MAELILAESWGWNRAYNMMVGSIWLLEPMSLQRPLYLSNNLNLVDVRRLNNLSDTDSEFDDLRLIPGKMSTAKMHIGV